jgi:hypothetical protein
MSVLRANKRNLGSSSQPKYDELVMRLKEINAKGYVRTHRTGNTGVGKTLEDLLGIVENNFPGPDGAKVELKSTRKTATSMITLFSKSPLPRSANTDLVREYGYVTPKSRNKKKMLHTTVSAVDYNTLRGKVGFKIDIGESRIELVTRHLHGELMDDFRGSPESQTESRKVVGYWDKETLKSAFEKKLPRVIFVRADSRDNMDQEEFWYNEAWLLSGFSFEGFLTLLRDGKILTDVRIGQHPDGRGHDHGTCFRVRQANLDICFAKRDRIM